MLPEFVKQSKLYKDGEGWLKTFVDEIEESNSISIDESKLALGEGYSIFLLLFGYTDPIIGDVDGPFWYEDKNLFLGVIDYLHKTEEWEKFLRDKIIDLELSEYTDDMVNTMKLAELYDVVGLDLLTEAMWEANERDDLRVTLGEKGYESNCIIGITDSEYLADILKFKDDFYHIVEDTSYSKVVK